MDDQRFDHLSRRLGARLSRRGAMARAARALAGSAAVSLAASRDARAARATCRAMGRSCSRSQQCCSGYCPTGASAPRADRNRCSPADGLLTCGAIFCPPGHGCVDGRCVTTCTPVSNKDSCVLTTRGISNVGGGLVIGDIGERCQEDSQCPVMCNYGYDHCGCVIGWAYSDGPFNPRGGICSAWSGSYPL